MFRNAENCALKGANLLVVDDEFLIALNLEMLFFDHGAHVSVATTLSSAVDIALSDSFCAALLDVRLGRETSEPVANVLARRGVPFLFYTGHSLPDYMRRKFPRAPALPKPLGMQHLLSAAEELVRSRAA